MMRLAAEGLGGERGGETVFSGISFTLGEGEALTVTGPNGAGKSTLLRVICGLLPASEGTVDFFGGGEAFPDVASACHYLGHRNAMKAELGVEENLRFWQEFMGEAHLPPFEALEMVGLGDIGHLPFGYLSTGQKRRISIAKLLVSHRPIWLLDEPTAGLDRASERRVSRLIDSHRERGGIVVAATHLPLGVDNIDELRMGEC